MGRRGGKFSGKRVEAYELATKALELRKAGHTFDEIAALLHYHSGDVVRRSVERVLKHTAAEPAHEVRQMMLMRLEVLLKGLWAKAAAGDTFAVDKALKIMERQAKLLGLDAPVNHNHLVDGQVAVTLPELPPSSAADVLRILVSTGQLRLDAPQGEVIEGEARELPALPAPASE